MQRSKNAAIKQQRAGTQTHARAPTLGPFARIFLQTNTRNKHHTKRSSAGRKLFLLSRPLALSPFHFRRSHAKAPIAQSVSSLRTCGGKLGALPLYRSLLVCFYVVTPLSLVGRHSRDYLGSKPSVSGRRIRARSPQPSQQQQRGEIAPYK